MEAFSRREGQRIILPYTRVHGDAAFFADMEAHEIYNGRIPSEKFRKIILGRYEAYRGEAGLFECSFLQNTVETMLMFYLMPEEDILDFYREAFERLRNRGFVLVYLDAADIRRNLSAARKERVDEAGNEVWFRMMLDYLRSSPYGRANGIDGIDGIDGLVACMEHRQRIERRILTEIVGDRAILLPEKAYSLDALMQQLLLM